MIGYYVHHHGSGHLRRMRSIVAHLDEPVTVLSSLSPPAGPGEDTPWKDWVTLPRDDSGSGHVDVAAGGTLHWVPRHHPGLLARHAALVRWLEEARPSLVVVDVSVEVALLVRLCGIPVVVMAMPGDRSDRAHTLAHDQADALLAPWPEGLPSQWPQRWVAKTVFTGAIGQFDDRLTAGSSQPATREPGTVFVLWGTGGEGRLVSRLERAAEQTPDWRWRLAVPGEDSAPLSPDEVWHALRTSAVVLTHAGQNAVAETAAARAPAVVVADPRPFDEQEHTVGRLARLRAAVALTDWPEPEQWPTLLERAGALGGAGWERWNDGNGARRAARALEDLARGRRPATEVS